MFNTVFATEKIPFEYLNTLQKRFKKVPAGPCVYPLNIQMMSWDHFRMFQDTILWANGTALQGPI